MRISYTKQFQKHFMKLDRKHQFKVIEAVQTFQKNPFEPVLRNHALKGLMLTKRSFSVTGDLRIIFEEYENYTIILMLDVGTHNQIY